MTLKSKANTKIDHFRKNKPTIQPETPISDETNANSGGDLMDEMFPEPILPHEPQSKKLISQPRVKKTQAVQPATGKKDITLADIFEKIKQEGGVKNLPKRTHYYPDIYNQLLKKARMKEGLYENSYEHFISILDSYVRQFPGYQEAMDNYIKLR